MLPSVKLIRERDVKWNLISVRLFPIVKDHALMLAVVKQLWFQIIKTIVVVAAVAVVLFSCSFLENRP